jgi:hypothetical protein
VYDLGDVIPLSVNTYNNAVPPVLASAGSVALIVTAPSAAYVFDPVAPTSTGVYVYTFTPLEAGRHTVRWVATGANASAYSDAFDVEPALSPALVSFARVRAHENFLTTADDDELRPFISAASTWAEKNYGPLGRATFTETRTPANGCVPLSHWAPGMTVDLVSVVGAYGYSATLDVATLHVTDAGILEANLGAYLPAYPLAITYQAGSTLITEDVQIGVLEVIAGLWETQHGGGGGGGPEALLQAAGEGELVANMGLRYYRADMLLKSSKAPVVA